MASWQEEAISMVSWVQRGGPLAEFADGYRDELVCRGFTANSVVTHVVLMGQLSRWMAGARVAVEDLAPARVEEFFDSLDAYRFRRQFYYAASAIPMSIADSYSDGVR
jgi:hypothetical protein